MCKSALYEEKILTCIVPHRTIKVHELQAYIRIPCQESVRPSVNKSNMNVPLSHDKINKYSECPVRNKTNERADKA